jgi:SAM-dependent methyltransferase
VEPRRALRSAARAIDSVVPWGLIYRGDRLECPCCGGRFRRFRSWSGRPDAGCPACGCLERHRALWLWITRETSILSDDLRVLHIAPEPVFEERLRRRPNLSYTGGDLRPRGDQVRVDLTDIPFGEASFDLVICNHVLEEVPDDGRAIREMYRVLAPGGRLVTQTPVDRDRAVTDEDPSLPPAERRSRFGADVNVRTYGLDFPSRLEAPGFDVRVVRYVDELDPETVERHALREVGGRVNGQDIHVAAKPLS